ncbi:MAG: PA2778 family cysteine peptidase [Sulfurifustis sp.]
MRASAAARAVAGGLFGCILLLGGCATSLQSARLTSAAFPDPVELKDVPFFAQEDYQCGPAALAMALDWAGAKLTPDMLTPEVYTPARRGSLQVEMLAGARRHGAIPYVLRPALTDLLAEVAAGHPVVVLQNLGLSWYPKWHYAVVVGFDVDRDEMVLHSGLEARHVVPLAVFERTWRRAEYWSIVVLPPGRLPKTAEETRYLQAIVALERLERWADASTAYRAALARWPDSLGAQLGLGNSRYALHDLRGAEQAYRAAAQRHPDAAVAFNNLAQTLADLGRWDEAETAVSHALALGGPYAETYRATADDIRARRAGGKPPS